MAALIGLSGKQYAGKDEAASILLRRIPELWHKSAQQRPIAATIKAAYAAQQGLSLTELETHKATHRPGLIALGNQGRKNDPDYWLNALLKEAEAFDGVTIISDVRLPHEYQCLRRAGAYCIRVEASRAIRAQRGTLVSEEDPTECGLDSISDWDTVWVNESTPEALEITLTQWLKAHLPI
ncbi:MAG: hypothetical protein U0003_01190 [Vampirovibrionales bacterium]